MAVYIRMWATNVGRTSSRCSWPRSWSSPPSPSSPSSSTASSSSPSSPKIKRLSQDWHSGDPPWLWVCHATSHGPQIRDACGYQNGWIFGKVPNSQYKGKFTIWYVFFSEYKPLLRHLIVIIFHHYLAWYPSNKIPFWFRGASPSVGGGKVCWNI